MTAKIAGKVIRQLLKKLIVSGIIIGLCILVMQLNLAIGIILMMLYSSLMVLKTSRNEMPLGKFTAILPALMSLASFFFMLALIGVSNPLMPIAGLAAGIIPGWLMARGHRVYEKNGIVYAKRTFFYIFIWILSMLFTQGSTLKGLRSTITDFGFLLNGFSTAMMVVLSILLFTKISRGKIQTTSITTNIIFFIVINGLLVGGTIQPTHAITFNNQNEKELTKKVGNYIFTSELTSIMSGICKEAHSSCELEGTNLDVSLSSGIVARKFSLPKQPGLSQVVYFTLINTQLSSSSKNRKWVRSDCPNDGEYRETKVAEGLAQMCKVDTTTMTLMGPSGRYALWLEWEYNRWIVRLTYDFYKVPGNLPDAVVEKYIAFAFDHIIKKLKSVEITEGQYNTHNGSSTTSDTITCRRGDMKCCEQLSSGGPVPVMDCFREGGTFQIDERIAPQPTPSPSPQPSPQPKPAPNPQPNPQPDDIISLIKQALQDIGFTDDDAAAAGAAVALIMLLSGLGMNAALTAAQVTANAVMAAAQEAATDTSTESEGRNDESSPNTILDGAEAVQWMKDNGYYDKNGNPTRKYHDFMNSPHSQEGPGLQGFAGDIDENGNPTGDFAIVISNEDEPDSSPPESNEADSPVSSESEKSEKEQESKKDEAEKEASDNAKQNKKTSEPPSGAENGPKADDKNKSTEKPPPASDPDQNTNKPEPSKTREEKEQSSDTDDTEKQSKKGKPEENKEDPGFFSQLWNRGSQDVKDFAFAGYEMVKYTFTDGEFLINALKGSAEDAEKVRNLFNGKAAAQAGAALGEEIRKDPRILSDTLAGSAETVKQLAADAKDLAIDAGNRINETVKETAKGTQEMIQFLSSDQASEDKTEILAETLKETVKDIYRVDENEEMAAAIRKTLSDPDKVYDGVKSLTGIQDFEDSWDPDKSVYERVGHSLLGTLNVGDAIGAAQVVKNVTKSGAKSVLNTIAGSGASFVDDGARAAASLADKTGDFNRATKTAATAINSAGDLKQTVKVVDSAQGAATDTAAILNRAGDVHETAKDVNTVVDAADNTINKRTLSGSSKTSGEDVVELVTDSKVQNPIHAGTDVSSEAKRRMEQYDYYLRNPDGKMTHITDQAVVDLKPRGRQTLIKVPKEGTGVERVATIEAYGDQIIGTEKTGLKNRVKNEIASLGNSADNLTNSGARTSSNADEFWGANNQERIEIGGEPDYDGLSKSAKKSPAEYAETLENRHTKKGSTIPAGKTDDIIPAEGVTPDTSGYTLASQKHMAVTGDKYGVQISGRPTNSVSSSLLERGEAVPKCQLLKNKTISKADTYIGFSPDDIGKVGHGKPVKPDWDTIPGNMRSEVQERYAQRAQEFVDQKKWLEAHKDQVRIEGNLIVDTKTGKPFTGDVDLFDIRGMHGETLPASVTEQITRELKEGMPGITEDLAGRPHRGHSNVMHGRHNDWDWSGYDNKTAWEKHVTVTGDKHGVNIAGDLPIDSATGKAVPGAIDSLVIKGVDGRAPSATVVKQIKKELKDGVQFTGEGQSKRAIAEAIDKKIRRSHAPGNEALVTYFPDLDPKPGSTPNPKATYWNGGDDNPFVD